MRNAKLLSALKAAFTGFEANDKSQLFELIPDDFHFEMSDSLPYGGVFVGRAEFEGYWREVGRTWTYFRYDAHEILEVGDTIVVPVQTDSLSKSGFAMRNEHLFLFKARDGVPVFCRLYADTARGRDVFAGHAPIHYPRVTLGA